MADWGLGIAWTGVGAREEILDTGGTGIVCVQILDRGSPCWTVLDTGRTQTKALDTGRTQGAFWPCVQPVTPNFYCSDVQWDRLP